MHFNEARLGNYNNILKYTLIPSQLPTSRIKHHIIYYFESQNTEVLFPVQTIKNQ